MDVCILDGDTEVRDGEEMSELHSAALLAHWKNLSLSSDRMYYVGYGTHHFLVKRPVAVLIQFLFCSL